LRDEKGRGRERERRAVHINHFEAKPTFNTKSPMA
jgi:hypothetical protein